MNPSRPVVTETAYVGYASINGVLHLYDDVEEFRDVIKGCAWSNAGWISEVKRHVKMVDLGKSPSLQLPVGFSIKGAK